MTASRSVGLLFVILAVLNGVGCSGISATHAGFIRYNPADDSFSQLDMWINIDSTRSRESAAHIESLWKRRDSILVNPLDIFQTSAMELQGQHRFREIDLASPTDPGSWQIIPTIDFESIQVEPGEFYLNELGNLCYFHQARIPGKTLDAIISAVKPKLQEAIVQGANEQLSKYTPDKNAWNDYRAELLYLLDQNAGIAGEQPKKISRDTPLDGTSLKSLSLAGLENPIRVRRDRDRFITVIPLSPSDCEESIATLNAVRNRIAQLVQQEKHVEAGLPEFVEAISLHLEEGRGLEVSVAFTKLSQAIAAQGKRRLDTKSDASSDRAYKRTVDLVKQRNLPIHIKTSVNDVLDNHLAK